MARYREELAGWASTIISIYFLGGIQLFMLGMIGEYLGRLYLTKNETPQYIVEKSEGDFGTTDDTDGKR